MSQSDPEAAQQPSPGPVFRLGRTLVILILMGLAVHLLLPQIASLQKSTSVLRSMLLGFVALAVLAQVLSYVGSSYLLHAVLSIGKLPLSIGRGMLVTLGASSIGLVAGGMFGAGTATYRWLHRQGDDREWATLAGILPSALNNAVLAALSVFGLIHLFITHTLNGWQVFGFGVSLLALVILILGMAWGLRHRTQTEAIAERVGTFWARLRRRPYNPAPAQQNITDLFRAWELLRGGRWQYPLLGAVFNTVFDMFTLFFLFAAAGHAVSPGVLLTGYALPLLLGKVTFVLPGGVGVVESSMAALYTSLGVPEAVSVVVILGYRLLSFWLPSLLGFLAVFLLQRQKNLSTDE
jgi:uncharacterized protein (TIRG00374 family)